MNAMVSFVVGDQGTDLVLILLFCSRFQQDQPVKENYGRDNNNSNTLFIQGDSISIHAAVKRSPVLTEKPYIDSP